MTAKPDTLDRLAQLLLLVAAVTTIANGLFMLVKPLDWYVFVPTVVTTGPPNAHFIRDIGLAYLGSGLILLYATADPARHWRAAVVGGLWLTFHGLLTSMRSQPVSAGPRPSGPTPLPSSVSPRWLSSRSSSSFRAAGREAIFANRERA